MTTSAAGHRRDQWANSDVYEHVEEQCRDLLASDNADEMRRLREQIIATCLPLADNIAHRYAGRGESTEDLTQVARLALVKVVNRYDPDKGRFLGYAVRTIIGEVRRHFRDNTWGMRVPRRVKDTRLRMRGATEELTQRLGRAPTAHELAAELDIRYEDVIQAVEAAYAYRPLSLDATVASSGSAARSVARRQGARDPRYETIEDVMAVAGAVPELSHRQRAILRMRFCDCRTQTEIGRALGISQVHVSRLLSAALERLRVRLVSDMPMVLPVVMALPLIA